MSLHRSQPNVALAMAVQLAAAPRAAAAVTATRSQAPEPHIEERCRRRSKGDRKREPRYGSRR